MFNAIDMAPSVQLPHLAKAKGTTYWTDRIKNLYSSCYTKSTTETIYRQIYTLLFPGFHTFQYSLDA